MDCLLMTEGNLPSEEFPPGGALTMIKEGCLETLTVEEVYGYHCWPVTPVGTLAAVSGPILAAQCEISITINGKGGHASMPHVTHDPIVCAEDVIMSLQTIVSRKVSCKANCVISIGVCHGGEIANVIPDTVKLSGTMRTTDISVMDFAMAQIQKIAEHGSAANDCTADVTLTRGYPLCVNHVKETAHVNRVAKEILGDENCLQHESIPVMASEDFSYYLLERPGCFWFMGGWEEGRSNANNHNTKFDFNDKCLPHTVHVFVRVVKDRLGVAVCPDLDSDLPMQRLMKKEE